MCETLVWSFDAIRNIQWLEVIKALAPAATAIVAFLALRNWQRQDKAKREAEFLDSLIEASHTYIADMHRPIALLEIIKIGMESHAPTWESSKPEEIAIKGAIEYIKKNGEHDGKRLLAELESMQPAVIKLRSLVAKGQIFKFFDYSKCQNAAAELTWQFDRIEALMAIICSPSLNWENSEVLALLKKLIAIEPSEIRKSVEATNIALLEFASKTYIRMYG